jgi:hypothetical protein
MLTRRVATRVVGARAHHVPASEPIGNGTVRKLDFNFHKPVYVAPTWSRTFLPIFTMFQYAWIPMASVCATLIFANHGAFSGNFPPNPKSLWN